MCLPIVIMITFAFRARKVDMPQRKNKTKYPLKSCQNSQHEKCAYLKVNDFYTLQNHIKQTQYIDNNSII